MAMEMHLQDQIEGTRSNNSGSASNCHSNGGTKSENVVQLWDISPVGNNHTSKVRKPYTITKQREKWTDEEHKKFLEALKLYGRRWRQIEEHIGTKTAVQIRSHAQKFFSKVVQESDGRAESSIKPIDIPPPRPKRKPLHPYPRKSVDSFKGPSILNEPERSPSPNLLVTEKETQSPISVLSAFGSEAFGSAFSEKTNRCLSPNPCTSDIHSASLSPVENENDCMASNSSEEEEKESLASVPLSTNSNPRLSMKSKLSSTETEESTNVPHPRVTSIKLFGRAVSMVGNGKSLNVDEDNIKLIICNSDEAVVSENEKRGQGWPFNQLDTQLSLGMCNSNWSVTADGIKVKSTEYPKENLCFGESAPDVSLPWWNLCHGPAVFWPCNQILNPTPLRPLMKQNSRENESSCTGSNAESVNDTQNREKSSDAVDSQCQPSHHGEGIAHQNSAWGFVPYKRCLAERDGNSLIVALEEREG